jgi:hypothetical protein
MLVTTVIIAMPLVSVSTTLIDYDDSDNMYKKNNENNNNNNNNNE